MAISETAVVDATLLAKRSLKKINLLNRIEWVKDGEEALDFLFHRGVHAHEKSDQPKVVLLDLRLPKVDGIEVLKAIRAEPAMRSMPVVILTSSKENKDMLAAYDLGVNSYVPKPIAFDEFSKTVADLGLFWVLVNQVPNT